MPFFGKTRTSRNSFFLLSICQVSKGLADLDEPFLGPLVEHLEDVVLDDTGEGFVPLRTFKDEIGYFDRGVELGPDFAADFSQSVTAVAFQVHEDGFPGNIRGHRAGPMGDQGG
jgi:hypothetical protein